VAKGAKGVRGQGGGYQGGKGGGGSWGRGPLPQSNSTPWLALQKPSSYQPINRPHTCNPTRLLGNAPASTELLHDSSIAHRHAVSTGSLAHLL
jgi:hypothetical protein